MILTSDGTTKLLAPSTSGWTVLVVSMVGIFYCAAYFCQMSSVANAPSSVVAPYFNIEPVVTTTIAVLLLGETMTYLHMIGGGMIVAALLATSLIETKVPQNG
jgi:drug/metabolite transporter (DMT)-like permease